MADEKVIQELQSKIDEQVTTGQAKAEALEKKYYEELPSVLSKKLAERQKKIIDTRADEILTWFCEADIDDPASSVSVDDFPVDLQEQPCIGMASENDPPTTLRRYSVNTPDIARTVASKAIASMRNRTDAESNAFFLFTKIAKGQYDPTTENRCVVLREYGTLLLLLLLLLLLPLLPSASVYTFVWAHA